MLYKQKDPEREERERGREGEAERGRQREREEERGRQREAERGRQRERGAEGENPFCLPQTASLFLI